MLGVPRATMAPSWTVNVSAGPPTFQSVKSLPLKRLVKPGSGVVCTDNASSSTAKARVRIMRGSVAPEIVPVFMPTV